MKKTQMVIGALALVVAFMGGYFYYEYSKVQVTEVLEGMGAPGGAHAGQKVIFDYRGYLYAPEAPMGLGKEFDSSYNRHTPMTAVLGAKQVIPGLDKALVGMKPGGQRRVVIAPAMAYGKEGAGGGLVPPNATLVYQLELRAIE